eukprot:scaffold209_cov396-Prasinococcus_capsulatus_cf.AAC.6
MSPPPPPPPLPWVPWAAASRETHRGLPVACMHACLPACMLAVRCGGQRGRRRPAAAAAAAASPAARAACAWPSEASLRAGRSRQGDAWALVRIVRGDRWRIVARPRSWVTRLDDAPGVGLRHGGGEAHPPASVPARYVLSIHEGEQQPRFRFRRHRAAPHHLRGY